MFVVRAGPRGVTWDLCWLIVSTTGHHLDPTVVNTSKACRDFSSLILFCCSPWLSSFFLLWFALFIWGHIKWWWWCSWFTQGQRTCSSRILSTNSAPEGRESYMSKCFPISKYLECMWPQIGFFIHTNGLHEFLTHEEGGHWILAVPIKFPMNSQHVYSNASRVLQHVPSTTLLCPKCFAHHCTLGTCLHRWLNVETYMFFMFRVNISFIYESPKFQNFMVMGLVCKK